jgi:hypothetical protein
MVSFLLVQLLGSGWYAALQEVQRSLAFSLYMVNRRHDHCSGAMPPLVTAPRSFFFGGAGARKRQGLSLH